MRLGAQVWGFYESGRLESLCYVGANMVPVEAGPAAAATYAERARKQGRRCSSIAGPAGAVGDLWRRLAPYWDRPREIRDRQPLMAIASDPLVGPDPGVRLVRPGEVGILLPASVAMFTEEVGISPIGRRWRRRLSCQGQRTCRLRALTGQDRGRAGRLQGRDRSRHCGSLPDSGRVGAPRAARPRSRKPGDGRRRRVRAELTRARGQPVRQRLQPSCQGRLPQGRLHRGRHLHVSAVLIGAVLIGAVLIDNDVTAR